MIRFPTRFAAFNLHRVEPDADSYPASVDYRYHLRRTDSKEMEFASLTSRILDCACKVHSAMGIGLLESVYQQCLAYELTTAGLTVGSEVPIPVQYKGISFDCAFRADLVVNDTVLVELKAADRLTKRHQAQVINYLGLTNFPVALLMNFNEVRLVDGVRRFENRLNRGQS